MHRLSIFAVTCVALGLGFSSSTRAESPPEAQMAAAPGSVMQEGDDVLEVLLLPLEAVRLEALGVPGDEVKLAVAVFEEAGMSPGDAASVVRLEEAISKRRGVRKGFGQHVLAQVAEGKSASELARSLREREDAPDVDEASRKELMKAVTARRKVELAKVAELRKRVTEKRGRGERVMIRGQMRLRGVAPASSGDGGLTIDVAWLEKRLMRVQQRMIRLDQQRSKLAKAGDKGQGKALARGEGLDKQRERLLGERAQLTDFIKRMKELDADGRLEGSARILALVKLANVGIVMVWGFAVTFVFVRVLPIAEFQAFLLLVAFGVGAPPLAAARPIRLKLDRFGPAQPGVFESYRRVQRPLYRAISILLTPPHSKSHRAKFGGLLRLWLIDNKLDLLVPFNVDEVCTEGWARFRREDPLGW